MNPTESLNAKRKRSVSDDAVSQPPNPPSASSGNVTQINYLKKISSGKLKLIDGDPEIFGNVLGLIDEYEGVLQRHESLAANLGAKLVAPLLLKSFEKVFDGPIQVIQAPYGMESMPITWLDIVDYARSQPNSFVLSDAAGAGRVCQFWVRGYRVQISEDDYMLIVSGAPARMIPPQPVTEDEAAEVGTMDILEQRLQILIRRADLVAGRARQLNYHMKNRKSAIQTRIQSIQPAQSQMPPPQLTNNRQSVNGESKNIHEDLLRQFITSDDRKLSTSRNKPTRPLPSPQPVLGSPSTPSTTLDTTSSENPNQHSHHRLSLPHPTTVEELTGGQYRPLMTAKNERLTRGDPIWPPCDRCRRLRMDCSKYLTACTGCTKKHAKCTWNDISEEEISYLGGVGDAVAVAAGDPTAGEDEGEMLGDSTDVHHHHPYSDVGDLNPNLDPGLRGTGDASMTRGGGDGYASPQHSERRSVSATGNP